MAIGFFNTSSTSRFVPGRDVVHTLPSWTHVGPAQTTGSTGTSSGGTSAGTSWETIFSDTLSSALSGAQNLDAYLTRAYEESLERLMPDWRQQVFGTAKQSISDINHLAGMFREGLPGMMAKVDEISNVALDQVNALLRGELPADVAAQVKRHAAEISNQIGVRGQASQYLTARDLGRTSLDMIDKGMQYAPTATTLRTDAYGKAQGVLATPLAAAGTLADMLKSMKAPTVDAGTLFGAMLPQAVGHSQFLTDTANENYWNQVNAALGREAVGVSRDQLAGARRYNQDMLDLQRQQQEWTRTLTKWMMDAESSSGSGVDFSALLGRLA